MEISPFAEQMAERFKALQDEITLGLSAVDGKKFHQDMWERSGGGGGRTRVLQHGNIIEKGGVNFSAVHGTLPESVKKAFQVKSASFFASGVSIVIHPQNPWVPIIHMNVRYFEVPGETYWFGGGIDLTPHYIDKEQASFFHTELKNTCDRFDPQFYPRFKNWADDYFFIPHREETRGVGGIFFDKLNTQNYPQHAKDVLANFVMATGYTFLPAYTQLIELNKSKQFSTKEKEWQKFRRGRYVEFNLVHDRGTKFGLETQGRIDSILMSLPLEAGWPYGMEIESRSKEQQTLDLLKKGIDWV